MTDNRKPESEQTIPERAVHLICDIARQNWRALNGGKTDEELGLDQEFFPEIFYYYWCDKVQKIKNRFNRK